MVLLDYQESKHFNQRVRKWFATHDLVRIAPEERKSLLFFDEEILKSVLSKPN